MSLLLNRYKSIKKKSEIREVFKYGQYIITGYGKIILHTIQDDNVIRSAFFIKKYCGNAVYRNYIKRILPIK